MTERRPSHEQVGKRVSLYPLSFEEALKALLETPPEKKESRPKAPDQNDARPQT